MDLIKKHHVARGHTSNRFLAFEALKNWFPQKEDDICAAMFRPNLLQNQILKGPLLYGHVRITLAFWRS